MLTSIRAGISALQMDTADHCVTEDYSNRDMSDICAEYGRQSARDSTHVGSTHGPPRKRLRAKLLATVRPQCLAYNRPKSVLSCFGRQKAEIPHRAVRAVPCDDKEQEQHAPEGARQFAKQWRHVGLVIMISQCQRGQVQEERLLDVNPLHSRAMHCIGCATWWARI